MMDELDARTNFDRLSSGPLGLFSTWLLEAEANELNDPNAMFLATVDTSGMPNIRTVLMKGFDEQGFVFYTNLSSAKGHEIRTSNLAALCFHWKSFRRQVRLRGCVEAVSEAEADEYFGSRPRTSQLGAWASRQSKPLTSRTALLKEVAKYAAKFGFGTVSRPGHWSGFRLMPLTVEFWQEEPDRIDDRQVFTRENCHEPWSRRLLQP